MSHAHRPLPLLLILVCAALAPSPLAGAGSTSVVISQVYGGGGNAGATFKNDFIELHNVGAASVDVTGWSVQYAATGGTSWQMTPLAGSLAPGQYYLIKEAAGAGGTVDLPAPDATGTGTGIAMAAGAGKVALVNTTALLTGTGCPFSATVIDFVGYGTGTNCFEGTGPTATIGNTTATLRAGNGCTDTDNNAADFASGAPAPRNTASTSFTCSGLPSTPPTATSATADPNVAAQGAPVTFTVVVKPGANPASTNISVTGNFSAIGASATFSLTGANAATGELTFTAQTSVGAQAALGTKSLPITIGDAQGRQITAAIAMAVRSTTITRIHDIQGSGSASPLAGMDVTTEGIVTGVRSNGFFIQDLPANYDADPNTSEGVFVFTSSTPPAGAAVGNLVLVIAKVQEFVPSADLFQPPTTELGSPFVAVEFTGQAIPDAVELTSADLNPDGSVGQLERLEGMRVSMMEMTVVAPTEGTVNESAATSTSDGIFYGVLPGTPRPFREPGIEVFEPVPADATSPNTVPRFDANPERIRVDSDAIGGVKLDVTPGADVKKLVGPLDYGFRSYTIDPEPASVPLVSGGLAALIPAREPGGDQFTVASANLERFFDTINDPNKDDAVLTQTAFGNRLNKVSLQIRAIMQSPDIIGVEEVENLATLQTIATKVNSDATAGGSLAPNYVAYLEEGNDVGGIDSGFLVKTARVDVLSVTQEGKATLYETPDGTQALLNDRPPLVLEALVHQVSGDAGLPVTVIVNHLRSLSGINDPADGARVRAKRRAQAEYLANLIQARQTADSAERIISVGDYNAFQFNDGYVDSIGTIKGTPSPADLVTLASPDLVNPDLIDLVETVPAGERYSFVFDGNAQELDHVIVTPNAAALSDGLSYGRSNADFPESFRNDPNSPARVSDHDPIVAYFAFPVSTVTALTAAPPTSTFGEAVTFTATVTANGGPVGAGFVMFSVDGNPLGGPVGVDAGGKASFTTTTLPAGLITVSASYSGAGALQRSSASITQHVIPSISIDDIEVHEPDKKAHTTASAVFTVTLSAPSTDTVSVHFATANLSALAGSDYAATSGTLVFAPGTTTGTIAVDVLAHPRHERTERFTVNLSGATNAAIDDSQGIGTILDFSPQERHGD